MIFQILFHLKFKNTIVTQLHQELPLARMEIRLPELTTGRERRSEFNFNVISTIRSFTLSAKSAQIRDEWVMALIETISHFQSKRSSYQQQPTADSYETESYLGQQVNAVFYF